MMHDYFQAGDVISIDNADRPKWATGQWRVAWVSTNSVLLQPLNEDGSVDLVRDADRTFRIVPGGLVSEPRYSGWHSRA